MPTNTYGPNDNYDPLNSHFLFGKIIHLIKEKKSKYLFLWGNGKPKRELIYVDDLADACIYFLFKNTKNHLINIGTGKGTSV